MKSRVKIVLGMFFSTVSLLSACALPTRRAAVMVKKLIPCLDVAVKPGKHIHARVFIQQFNPAQRIFNHIQIPGHIGTEPLEDGKKCYREIHTHAQDNRLHIEAAEENNPHTLKQFLRIWKEGADLIDYGNYSISILAYRPPRDQEKKGEWKFGLSPADLVFEDAMEVIITIVPLAKK